MDSNVSLIKKRTVRSFVEVFIQYETVNEIITYFEDEDFSLNVDKKNLEDNNYFVNDLINSIRVLTPSDLEKLFSVIETFIARNKNKGLLQQDNFKTFLEFMYKDNIGYNINTNKFELMDLYNKEENPQEQDNEDTDLDSEDGNSLEHLSEDEREVFIEPVQYSIFELHRKYKRGDLILSPFYQRGSVWKIPKKSKLIESVLRKIPIPSLYFAERNDGKWEVVDGQQRLRAFFDYLEGDFKLSKLPVLINIKGLSFNRLNTIYQRRLEDYQLHIFIISKDSHRDVRFDIFERINEGATQLNAQELRNSMYREGQIEFIKELSKDKHFIALTKGKLQVVRLKDQEAVLRFLSFYLQGYIAYNGNLNSFLNLTMDNFSDNYEKVDKFKKSFSITMKTILSVFGPDAFVKHNSKIINMSLFDILTYSFSKFPIEELLANSTEIVNMLNNLIENDEEFNRSISHNTLSKKSVYYRFDEWMLKLNEIIEGRKINDRTI